MRLLTLLLAFLAAPLAAQEARILVIGDSIMAWNGDRSIANVLAAELGEPVRDESVSGAQLSHRLSLIVGPMDIRAQVPRGDFDWVIVTGGGNDLAVDCDCGDCAAVLDSLISEDGQLGDIPDFIGELRRRGAQVLWAQYYDDPVGGGPFTACMDELAILDARLTRFAAETPGVHIADMSEAIDASDLKLYDPDRLHPSMQGSEAIGAFLAKELRRLSI